MNDDRDELAPDTLPLPLDEPYEIDEDERVEVLLEWAPVIGDA